MDNHLISTTATKVVAFAKTAVTTPRVRFLIFNENPNPDNCTPGINCNQCQDKYYRPRGKHWNETDVCQRKFILKKNHSKNIFYLQRQDATANISSRLETARKKRDNASADLNSWLPIATSAQKDTSATPTAVPVSATSTELETTSVKLLTERWEYFQKNFLLKEN